MTIDMGASCITRVDVHDSGKTLVAKENPANATGLITSVCVYSTITKLSGIEVATFSASGDDLTTRQNVALADQPGVGQTIYEAPADFMPFEVKVGDYIGIYFTSGKIYMSTSGFAGVWSKTGDYIPCTSETFNAGDLENCGISLYATGYQLGKINIGDVWKDIQNIKINVGDDWKQIIPGSKINISDVWKDIFT